MSAYGLTRGAWIAVAAFAGGSVVCGMLLPSTGLVVLGAIVLALSVWLAVDTPPVPRETRGFRLPTRRHGTDETSGSSAEGSTTADSGMEPVASPPERERMSPVTLTADPAPAPVFAAAPRDAAPVPVSVEPGVVLGFLLDAAGPGQQPAAAHLWLADTASGTLRLVRAAGAMPPSSQPLQIDGDDVLSLAYVSDTAQTAAVARVTTGESESRVWRYAVPVKAGEASGAAAVDIRCDVEPDFEPVRRRVDALRGSLAGALALHVARTELETAQALIESARELSRLLDPKEVLARSLRKAMDLSGASTGSIMLLEPETGRLVIALSRGLPAEVVRETSLAEGEGIAGWVLASGQPLLIEDLPARTPAARRHGIRSAVSVPIGDDDGMLGVLNVGSRTFPARFTQSHLAAIEILAKQTATALRNAQAIEGSRELYFDTLKALALAMETKDPYAEGGTERVLELASALGGALGLAADELDALRVASLLHDIGMSAAGEGVLTADRPLSTVERALLKMHPQIAAEMLAQAPALRYVVPIVYHHHEWYDGDGYLGGLVGERIPIGARILAVADAYVAMTSERPYRAAMTRREALREVIERAGTQFDPLVVDALRDVLEGGPNRVPGSNVERG